MNNFRTFPSTQAARDYRHANGTGGWIFSPDDGGETILFPPDMPPIAIFHHPMTRGKSGTLIGSA
jgi:hypothetical protein